MESKRVKSKCGELHEEEEARTKKVCVLPRERIVNDGGKESITCEYKHSSSTILHFAASNVASRLFGKIDGMTDVLVVEEGEDGEWRMEPIVIEVKNRVNGFRDPPPVYDQIQTTVYMKMLDCRQADLIQCITDDRAKVHVSRITLDDPPLHTGAAWKDILVPRMFKYAQVIYKVRSNPMLRLAILNSEEEAQRNIILDLCPWLS